MGGSSLSSEPAGQPVPNYALPLVRLPPTHPMQANLFQSPWKHTSPDVSPPLAPALRLAELVHLSEPLRGGEVVVGGSPTNNKALSTTTTPTGTGTGMRPPRRLDTLPSPSTGSLQSSSAALKPRWSDRGFLLPRAACKAMLADAGFLVTVVPGGAAPAPPWEGPMDRSASAAVRKALLPGPADLAMRCLDLGGPGSGSGPVEHGEEPEGAPPPPPPPARHQGGRRRARGV
jgi:hypothetical protein